MSKNCKPILVVAGEPYSVFLEIFFKSFRNNKFKKPIILIVSYNLLMKQMKSFNYKLKTNLIDPKKINYNDINSKCINIIDVNFKFIKFFDRISNKSNYYINKCFKIALDLLKTKKFSGMINGPISKKNFLGSKYLGITEFLANKTLVKKNVAMLIYNKKLSVSPLTTHLPIKRVHKNINKKKLIDQVKLINEFYKKKLNTIPKIAVTGLNPHCESNYTSSEEDRVIKPAIKYLKNNRFRVFGPFAADTIFLKENLKNYDVIIGMYHDQVLTPIKTLFGFDAINITLGLPFVRISPDHGPNTSMVGKNLSNPKSLVEALKFLDN
jgi:4-hydroxythreonine-4-phosphate dehydrogenase